MAMLGIDDYLCEACKHFDTDGNDGNHPFCRKQVSGVCCLHYGEDDDGYDGWYCDECGGWFLAVWRGERLVKPKHCQECGRKVVVE